MEFGVFTGGRWTLESIALVGERVLDKIGLFQQLTISRARRAVDVRALCGLADTYS